MGENSVIRGATNEEVGSEIKFAGNDNKDKMYEPKHTRKLVRVLTVIGYVFSVSLAAIMLSLFYIFIYNPWKPSGVEERALGPGVPKRSASQISFPTPLEGLSNDTFFEIDKEEPRALPLELEKEIITKTNKGWPPEKLENGTKNLMLRNKIKKAKKTLQKVYNF